LTKPDIQYKLKEGHQKFTEIIASLPDEEFLLSANGKWTAGQQLDHICRSVAALNFGLAVPKFLLSLYVGKANRPTRDYDAVIAKYRLKLEAGGKAVGRFIPKAVNTGHKTKLIQKLNREVDSMCEKIGRYNEQQLDDYILPHPLMGKLTIREMLYFTIYHVEHHQKLTLKNLGR